MSRDISRRSSRQLLKHKSSDMDTTSLTSFPDPAESTSSRNGSLSEVEAVTVPPTSSSPQPSTNEPLNGLLDAGPSMFDVQDRSPTDPQTLSTAPLEVLQAVIDHRGAVELVRNLSKLLAERDAHVTALTRLAEEYKVPRARLNDTAKRVKQAERRRLSLAGASEDLAPTTASESSVSTGPETSLGPTGTIRGLTKLFGGGGTRKSAPLRPTASTGTASSSRSASVAAHSVRDGTGRPKSIDVLSVNSTESASWTAALFGAAGTIKGLSNGVRRDSRASREPREPVEMYTRHDQDQLPPTLMQSSLSQPSKDPQQSEWNKYLVRLMKLREQAGEEARSGELVGASRFGNEGNSGRQKMEMLSRLVVGGIPMRLRHPIWMELSNTYSIMQPEAYTYYLNLHENEDPTEIEAIVKDVPRTLTSKYDYYAEKGYDRLKKVLIAFVNKYPGLGYTQGLNMIAGYLLLAIPDESDAFWVLCKMVDDYFPAEYFSKDTAMSAPLSDNVVLRQYVRELMPRLWDKMSELEVDPEHTVPLSWFLTAFASVLPETVLLRIWDVWLCLPNQKTFLFNIALTLLAHHAKNLIECQSQGEWFAYMSNSVRVSEEPERVNELIRQAFAMRRKLEQVEMRRALEMKRLKRHPSTDALYAPEPETEGEA
ncbi:hypothetical protein TI39_contig4145g00009 [Zymoseptoria brevis]|uniref:Rab-GAP TBC domain-containing protein n=1 Tax=Zymoseptoria brevis TaxID=1047168 RepID=A0A0F4GCB1_9PEZI|nr:hypothetical protein TI39_contig4145g00009 [Zymoseptoria brevis]